MALSMAWSRNSHKRSIYNLEDSLVSAQSDHYKNRIKVIFLDKTFSYTPEMKKSTSIRACCSGVVSGAFAGLLIFLLTSCGESEPGVRVENPREYLITALRQREFRGWWAHYADRSNEFLNTVIDSIEDSLRGELPHDSKKLDGMMQSIADRYRNMLLSEPYRDHILQSATERFHNPPMAIMEKGVALLDFHYLPGEWGKSTRGTEVLKNSPAIARVGFFEHETFVTALNKLVKKYPDAPVYQIRAKYYYGARIDSLLMQLSPNGPIYRKVNTRFYYVKDKLDWNQLLAGNVKLQEVKWSGLFQGDPMPSLINVSSKPLD